MIEDRFATNTKNKLKYTNDKFIGSTSEIMDKVCNLYNYLPKYLKDGIQFDGSTLIQHHIKYIVDRASHFSCPHTVLTDGPPATYEVYPEEKSSRSVLVVYDVHGFYRRANGEPFTVLHDITMS